jgi:hypothetical protein
MGQGPRTVFRANDTGDNASVVGGGGLGFGLPLGRASWTYHHLMT